MTWASLVVLFAISILCPIKSLSKESREYLTTAGNEQIRFVAQPEVGYVVKAEEKTGAISALSDTLSFLGAKDIRRVGGLGRRGILVVYSELSAGENEMTIKMLRANRQIEYAAPLFSLNGETVVVIPEIVIRVQPGVDERQVHFLRESMALAIIKPMEFTTQEYLLQVLGPDAESVFAALANLNNVEWIEWAAPNTAFQPKLRGQDEMSDYISGEQLPLTAAGQDANSPGVFPNDEYFPRQWHLHNIGQSGGTPGADINAPKAWEITTGDPNIVVALIDCGVDTNHPDLANNLVPGYDFYDDDNQPDPATDHRDNAHGTACAGLIAAQGNNVIGVTGVTWNCKIMPIRMSGVRADGTWYELTVADRATAFRWAAAHGADIFSDSDTSYSSPQPIVQSAIADVTMAGGLGRDGKGCIYLSAAGNGAHFIRSYPKRYPEVIAVGATDHKDQRCRYSNYGPELDITAPGGQGVEDPNLFIASSGVLWTTDISGVAGFSPHPPYPDVSDYTLFAGTSAACPIAAGVAALILSIEPNLTGEEARHFLERSAKDLGDPGWDQYYGWGRVDARAALDMVLAKRADLNNDWKVDEQDFAILNTAIYTNDLSADIAPAAKRDGVVDANDLELLTRYLGTVIPELGLIAHWKLDEDEGEVTHNSTGDPQYNADLHGGPLWQPTGGMVDGALMFDGTDDYVSTPYVLNPAEGAFSVFAWIKGSAPGQAIISQAYGANWLLADPSAGKLMTELQGTGRGAAPALMSNLVITDGQWHRIGLVWDGYYRSLYVDDVEVVKDVQAQTALASASGGLHIGAGSNLDAGSFWSGLIDDVRIYDKVRTP